MSSCFLNCIKVSQEAGQVVWYSDLFQNCPWFIVIHTVKEFGIVNKAEIDVFLELSYFFHDSVDVGIWSLVPLPFLKSAWTSRFSWFTYYWSLAWRILSITLAEVYSVLWVSSSGSNWGSARGLHYIDTTHFKLSLQCSPKIHHFLMESDSGFLSLLSTRKSVGLEYMCSVGQKRLCLGDRPVASCTRKVTLTTWQQPGCNCAAPKHGCVPIFPEFSIQWV